MKKLNLIFGIVLMSTLLGCSSNELTVYDNISGIKYSCLSKIIDNDKKSIITNSKLSEKTKIEGHAISMNINDSGTLLGLLTYQDNDGNLKYLFNLIDCRTLENKGSYVYKPAMWQSIPPINSFHIKGGSFCLNSERLVYFQTIDVKCCKKVKSPYEWINILTILNPITGEHLYDLIVPDAETIFPHKGYSHAPVYKMLDAQISSDENFLAIVGLYCADIYEEKTIPSYYCHNWDEVLIVWDIRNQNVIKLINKLSHNDNKQQKIIWLKNENTWNIQLTNGQIISLY